MLLVRKTLIAQVINLKHSLMLKQNKLMDTIIKTLISFILEQLILIF